MTPNNPPEMNQPEVVVQEQTSVVTVSTAPKEKWKPRFLVKNRSGMFDIPEIIAVSVGGFLILTVLLAYLFWLRPAQEQLRQREQTRNSLDIEYQKLKTTLGENQTTESQVANIVSSLERFEVNYLPAPGAGNSALFQRLNQLIASNNLRNTSGPSYTPIETVAMEKFDPAKEESRNQNVYPGVGVSVTVEGGYSNLRRFISDVENSRQFIVVRAIEIEAASTGSSSGGTVQDSADINTVRSAPQTSGIPSGVSGIPAAPGARPNSTNPRAPQQIQPQPQQQPVAPRVTNSGGRGSIVSMRLDLVSYFRRSGGSETLPATVQR
jgi:Tfp pilus assembly protein PilO